MANYGFEYQQNLRRIIRDMQANDPLITNNELTSKLSKKLNHSFDPRFIKKLSGKVSRQVMNETDRAQLERRLEAIRENYRVKRARLDAIIMWNAEDHPGERKPANKDVIEAVKTMVMLDLALLRAEMESGMYKKPIEVLAKEVHYEPLASEVRAVVIAAWTRGGLLPASTIERIVPVELPSNISTVA